MVAAEARPGDAAETPLRPQTLADFVGQPQACANLKVFIDAARARKEPLDHVLIVGEGPAARSVKIGLAPFTLVATTTRLGLMTTPLRDRFGIPVRLNFYAVDELEHIVARGARILGMPLSPEGATEIARRSRG